MERYIADHIQPKFDALDRRMDKVEHRIHDIAAQHHAAPSVDMEIVGTTPEFVLGAMRQAYQYFGACTNFRLKTVLNEVVQTTAAEGENDG